MSRSRLMFSLLCLALVSAPLIAQPQAWSQLGPNPPAVQPGSGVPALSAQVSGEGGLFGLYCDQPACGVNTRAQFFSNFGSFLRCENFQTNLRPDGVVELCEEPIAASSNDFCFSPGQISPGLAVQTVEKVRVCSGPGAGDCPMALLTTGFAGISSDVVGPNFFVDNTEMLFAAPSRVVAFDLLYGRGANPTFTYNFYSGATFIGFVTLTGLPINTPFWLGLAVPQNVTRVTVSAPGEIGDLVDNVCWGAYSVLEVPTLNTYGLAALVLALAALSFFFLRRRRTA